MKNVALPGYDDPRVVLMDTISAIAPQDRGSIVIAGSHGGAISGAFAAMHLPALVMFNDAGGGKNGGGRAAIGQLDAAGIPAAVVAHASARIGQAEDAWHNGILSGVGEMARRAGLRPGQRVQEAVAAFLRHRESAEQNENHL